MIFVTESPSLKDYSAPESSMKDHSFSLSSYLLLNLVNVWQYILLKIILVFSSKIRTEVGSGKDLSSFSFCSNSNLSSFM